MKALWNFVDGKTQEVRLIDVFALGPLMIWVATFPGAPRLARTALWLGGLATIVYNGRNYLRQENRTARNGGLLGGTG